MKRIVLSLLSVFTFIQLQAQTWTSGIAKILYAHCATCHRPGGIAPFSLTSYGDAYNYRYSIEGAITSSHMPPWNADPGYKHYAHERVLSSGEITQIQQWVANGAPSGDLRFAPPVPVYNSGSQLGTVNLSLKMNNYIVASNNDEYRNFVIPSGLAQVSYATAIELLPGNPSIVHHVLVFQDSTTNAISPTSTGGTGSAASKLIYGYAPGAQPYFTPIGTGIRLAANTRIILQIHYAPGSQGQLDSTRINFKLSTTAVRGITVNPLLNHLTNLTNGPLYIPANTTKTFNESMPWPGNWTFLTAFPHMHLLGRTFLTYAVKSTAPYDTIRFVNIPDWDFHWQDNFVFQHAVKIPNGYTLKASAFYDNTVNNPSNPNYPPQNVSAGEGTGDEMMMVFFSYLPYQTGDEYLIVDKRIIPKGATTFCEGLSVTLKTIEGPSYTYQWYRNGVSIAGATTSSYEASLSGNYTVYITCGPNNAVSDPVAVTVNPAPVATISPSGAATIPYGSNLTLNASTGTGYSYHWFRNDTLIAGATSSAYTTSLAGAYTVEVFNGCYAVSVPTTLTASTSNFTVSASSNPAAGGIISGGGMYPGGATVTVTATPNSGYVFVNWTDNGNPVSSNASYTFTISSNRTLIAHFTQATSLTVKCYIQGYYDAGNLMRPVLANGLQPNPATDCDTITIELHNSTPPYAIAASKSGVLHTNGLWNESIAGVTGGSYYIVFKHRNSLETWSKLPVVLSAVSSYDFSTAASKAYGDNQAEVAPGIFACYSGEIVNDNNIDLIDQSSLENGINNFDYGYVNTDLNGDGNVDILDSLPMEANVNSFIFVNMP